MKKTLILILLSLFIPTAVFAGTSANGDGNKVDFETGGTSGGGTQIGDKEYFFRSGQYGIRLSFYSENGEKLGKSIDVFDYKFNYNGKNAGNGFEKITISTLYGKVHAKTKVSGDSKSRIDYLNEYKGYIGDKKDFLKTTTKDNYIKYYDKGVLGFSTYVDGFTITTTCKNAKCEPEKNKAGDYIDEARIYKNDPLKYLAYNNRSFFKAYFTSSAVLARYAALAGANINMTNGDYYILIEPIFFISSLNCWEGSNSYCGHYTSTELGLMYHNSNRFKNFFGKSRISTMFYDSLRLEKNKSAQIGEYVFGSVSAAPTTTQIANAEFLEKGWGMAVISGKEVDSYKGGTTYRIVYHTISLENPFLDIDGKIRTLDEKSNWYNKKSVIDKDIYSKEPFLVVSLTPSTIKSIRKDNKEINYSKLNKDTYNVFYKKYSAIFED